jgi:hypothetical protein
VLLAWAAAVTGGHLQGKGRTMSRETAVSKEEYLRSQLEEQIKWFDDESTAHKNLFRRLRYVVFGLTACSSALAGLALAFPAIRTEITVVIVFTTAAIGIASSIEGLRKPSELWIHERTLYYSLKDLKRDLEDRSKEQIDPAVADTIYERMQDILGSARDRWSQHIAVPGVAHAQPDVASLHDR